MSRLTPAVMRSLDILELFEVDGEGLSAATIAARTGIPKASVHELVHTLSERRYLERTGTPPVYRLGVRLFQLGSAYAGRVELLDVAQRIASEVAEASTETVSVALRDQAEVFYLCKVESKHPVRMPSEVGRRLPAGCTSVGKALLAHLEADALSDLYGDPGRLPTLTGRSISTLEDLLEDLLVTRERGYSVERGEAAEGVNCVGAPVRDATGNVVASLSISVPDMRWTDHPIEYWGAMVVEGARRFSMQLGASA